LGEPDDRTPCADVRAAVLLAADFDADGNREEFIRLSDYIIETGTETHNFFWTISLREFSKFLISKN
jgi:hypothetical protein